MKLTAIQLHTIINRFNSSCLHLQQSGNYSEFAQDEEILNILMGMRFDAYMEEHKPRRKKLNALL